MLSEKKTAVGVAKKRHLPDRLVSGANVVPQHRADVVVAHLCAIIFRNALEDLLRVEQPILGV